ncbi:MULTISPECIES: maleylpyruvate isomerase N-terminal domain-containing protein [unclassified Mycobacterium]|uniref:maleylpyruvate isomerase N-terminal domain-containing protein n=1 Tax=unclassified Mycobacterium TaxID=2642494 RepID=UPI001157CC5E|nr:MULTISPECIES: maleylpyruvate isomerase N-terminal domain-containing protein [unclassified Mycobacterium]
MSSQIALAAASKLRDEAMREFISSLSGLQATAPTWCSGWSAHDLTAHVAAAAKERADLIDEHLAGEPARATRSWEVREPPFRAMPDAALRERLVDEAFRFESAVAALGESDTIVYTGWTMSAERLRMHSHSEVVLHRWDLVGDDDVSVRLLSDAAMVGHAVAVFDAVPALAEAQRWRRTDPRAQPVVLRSGGRPDVVVSPGEGLSQQPTGRGVVIELRPHELPLLLWGRCPSRMRDPNLNADSIADVLRRLSRAGGADSNS